MYIPTIITAWGLWVFVATSDSAEWKTNPKSEMIHFIWYLVLKHRSSFGRMFFMMQTISYIGLKPRPSRWDIGCWETAYTKIFDMKSSAKTLLFVILRSD